MNELMSEIEKYAKENKIPIIDRESLEYIINLIKEKNIKTILELGTAIGYSAINFALVDENIKITTIERDVNRYFKALKNIELFNLSKRIDVINSDIFDVELKEKYDFIFIDASKSQNERFLNKFKDNLNKDGIIVIDNLSFHGYVGKSSEIESKNLKSLVRKIEKFITYLELQDEFKVKIVQVGDVIGILERNKYE